jgi:hypothetical protein
MSYTVERRGGGYHHGWEMVFRMSDHKSEEMEGGGGGDWVGGWLKGSSEVASLDTYVRPHGPRANRWKEIGPE